MTGFFLVDTKEILTSLTRLSYAQKAFKREFSKITQSNHVFLHRSYKPPRKSHIVEKEQNCS